jgi:2-polyprenylphenol 6-hydroxylase
MSKTDQTIKVDIAIVGAGLVGATMAHLLAKSPYSVALLDRFDFDSQTEFAFTKPGEFDPRVSALSSASKQLFDRLGLWQAMTELRVSPYLSMHVWDADGTGSIDFSAADMGVPELGHIVENSVALTVLHQALAKLGNLQLLGGSSIKGIEPIQGGVKILRQSGSPIQASLVIAADGGRSAIRKLGQFQTKQWSYDHSAIITTVKTALPHQRVARQRFMDTGPLAFLPLSPTGSGADEHYCSIVWSCVPEMAEDLMALNEKEFNQRLELAIEHELGQIQSSAPRFSVPLNQMHALNYSKDNIVLIGDAAHTIHPLAGQGVNLGLLDAAALSKEIFHSAAVGRHVSDPITLNRYERNRKGHNLSTMWMMEGFKHLFAQDALPVRWLRNVGLKTLSDLPVIKNKLARHAMGLEN